MEDFWQEPLPQNVPGTYHERPNWRRKAAWPLEKIFASPAIPQILARVNLLRGKERS
jgi:4-alpha-glucanotransferase